MGIINYSGKFMTRLAVISEPLKGLLGYCLPWTSCVWCWSGWTCAVGVKYFHLSYLFAS